MRIRITSDRPLGGYEPGDEVNVTPQHARAWVGRGLAAYVNEGEIAEESRFADMDYNALRSLAAKRGIKPEGRTKDDYIAALEAAGTYNRRDMRAR